MANKNRFLLSIIYEIKLIFNKIILWLAIRLGLLRSIIIVPYHGYGYGRELFLVGRVLKDNSVSESSPEDSVWRNVRRMIRRFRTVVIPGVRVQANFQGQVFTALTNEEGYFEFELHLEKPLEGNSDSYSVSLTLVDQVFPRQPEVRAVGKVFVPSGKIDFGIISDIDDTIIPTGAMRLGEMLKTTFSKNAYARIPFTGVPELYQALKRGSDGIESNPFFYVSSSPWNLFDFLQELLQVHDIPNGPLMLRDIGLSRTELISGDHEKHKLEQIRKILKLYDSLPFILIGDSGQEDPEIYLKIVREFPGKILAVIIRDIHESRREFVLEKKAEMERLDVRVLLGKNTEEAKAFFESNYWLPN